MSKRYSSMRVPSVSPRGAVPWVPSNEVQRGNGTGERHEEGGKLHLIIFLEMPVCPARGDIASRGVTTS